MSNIDFFDIAVIGAGPAGATAACNAAKSGRKVCLLERKSDVGLPVRCGEGIGQKSLINHLGEIRPEWIKSTLKSYSMISPSGIRIDIGDEAESYTLDREKFDKDLVLDAIQAGAIYYNNTSVLSIKRESNNDYMCIAPNRTIKAKCLILSDGVESRLARQVGWDTALDMKDVETSAFTRVISPLIEKNSCIFYTGSKFSPGGYTWVFSRGSGEANVGLGICGHHSQPGKAKELLEQFINEEFPASKTSTFHCGAIPVAKWLRPLVRDNVMIVGDAARQVNCLSGGGIGYSLFAGKTAGTFAGQAFNDDKCNSKILQEYESAWKKQFGKQQERSHSLKSFLLKYGDDSFLDRVATSLKKENPARMNYLRVFMRTFSKNPILLFKAIQVFK